MRGQGVCACAHSLSVSHVSLQIMHAIGAHADVLTMPPGAEDHIDPKPISDLVLRWSKVEPGALPPTSCAHRVTLLNIGDPATQCIIRVLLGGDAVP